MKIQHNRCSLCNRKSNRLTEGIIMADLKAMICPSCFCKLKEHVELRGQLLHITIKEYREMVRVREMMKAQTAFQKDFDKNYADVVRVLGRPLLRQHPITLSERRIVANG